jgi:hypothetical protein
MLKINFSQMAGTISSAVPISYLTLPIVSTGSGLISIIKTFYSITLVKKLFKKFCYKLHPMTIRQFVIEI